MNIINDRELALRFKNGAVSSKERFIYFFTFILLSEAPYFYKYIFADNRRDFDLYEDIIMLAITIVGTIACYISNKTGDNREFVERYVCISFPVSVRATIFCIIIIIVSLVIYVAASIEIYFLKISLCSECKLDDLMDAWGSLVVTSAMIYFFHRLNTSIKLAAR
ncbi:hypothetical protein Ms3S1_01160 [Methylosinus sp. 3S-1]